MVAGGDRVTFENYTKGKGYDAKDEDWYFATYGPPSKPGQTWHERWKSVGGDGKGTTIAAATSADPSPFTEVAATLTTSELISKYKTSVEADEKMALESEMRNRWIKVDRRGVPFDSPRWRTCCHGPSGGVGPPRGSGGAAPGRGPRS
jgi:hypothetical protein